MEQIFNQSASEEEEIEDGDEECRGDNDENDAVEDSNIFLGSASIEE